jgi:glycosyltransferase involved in cell wall biosynthesis
VQGRLIDHFTGLAPAMATEIAVAMRVPPERITIIDDPALGEADHARLAAIGAARPAPGPASASVSAPASGPGPGPGRRYVAIGRLAAQKNFACAIDAFALAARPGDTLAIIGEGSQRTRLERRISARGLAGRVSLPGHGDAVAALAAADVFVLSSDYEALPAVVVEALASGLPVVATDCCVSMRDLVGAFGSVVPPGDSAALAAAMVAQPVPDAPIRAAMAAAMQRFTITTGARTYAALFGRLA